MPGEMRKGFTVAIAISVGLAIVVWLLAMSMTLSGWPI
jgi:hypothetical protein